MPRREITGPATLPALLERCGGAEAARGAAGGAGSRPEPGYALFGRKNGYSVLGRKFLLGFFFKLEIIIPSKMIPACPLNVSATFLGS